MSTDSRKRDSGVLGSPAPVEKRLRGTELSLGDASIANTNETTISHTGGDIEIQTARGPYHEQALAAVAQRVMTAAAERRHSRLAADRLRLRLQMAYFKVRTRQENVPLSKMNTLGGLAT